jgi:hypothetical protein
MMYPNLFWCGYVEASGGIVRYRGAGTISMLNNNFDVGDSLADEYV